MQIFNNFILNSCIKDIFKDDVDENFASPLHSDVEDEVDSDFDRPEEEDEHVNPSEEKEPAKKVLNIFLFYYRITF